MSDGNPNQIILEGVKYDALLACLKYMYCDELPTVLNENVNDLLQASGKLELKSITAICEKFLAISVTLENAIAMFKLAFKTQAQQLKAVALDLIVYNFDQVKKKPEFSNLEHEEFLEVTYAAMHHLALKRKFMESE